MPPTVVGLCGPGRHDIAKADYADALRGAGCQPVTVSGYLFPAIIAEPTNFISLEKVASDYFDELSEDGDLFLIVTGYSPALISTIKAWRSGNSHLRLHLLHWDSATNCYVIQTMWRNE